MSSNVDDEIVRLRLDNRDFEEGVQESQNSFEEFKRSLKLQDASKSISNVSKSLSKIDFAPMAAGVEAVSRKLSAMEIAGITAVSNIANRITNMGISLAKSVSVDQISKGYSKYEEKTASIQTLVNSTGKSVEEINGYLNQLMWFSDETSYSFTDMTKSLAQLTTSGGKIEDLIPMIEGIANATAFAGKGAAEFSRAIYNINQSYSAGAFQYIDWKSLDQAGVSSVQLKEAMIEAGKAVGTLSKEGKTANGTLVTLNNLSETLKQKWVTTDVMAMAFGKFSDATQVAYKMVQAGITDTASDAYGSLNEFAKKADTLVEKGLAKDVNDAYTQLIKYNKKYASVVEKLYSGENAQVANQEEALKLLAQSYDQVSRKAATSAQEAKSFTEAIDATKDAVSSTWMATFENIFGNYAEAKALWTDLANGLWEVFAASGNTRNEILALWKADGGRDALIGGVYDLIDAFSQLVAPVREAWYWLIGRDPEDEDSWIANMSTKLLELTARFKAFAQRMAPTAQAVENIRDTFKGLFAFLSLGKTLFTEIVRAIIPFNGGFNELLLIISNITAALGRFNIKLVDWIKQSGIIRTILKPVQILAAGIFRAILSIVDALSGLTSGLDGVTKKTSGFTAALNVLSTVAAVISAVLNIIVDAVIALLQNAGPLIATVTKFAASGVVIVFSALANAIQSIYIWVSSAIKPIKEWVSGLIEAVKVGAKGSNILQTVIEYITGKETDIRTVGDAFAAFKERLDKMFENIDSTKVAAAVLGVIMIGMALALMTLTKALAGAATAVGDFINLVTKKINMLLPTKTKLQQLSEGLLLMSASLYLISKIPAEDLWRSVGALGALVGMMIAFEAAMLGLTKLFKTDKWAGDVMSASLAIIAFSGAVALLAIGLKVLSGLTFDKNVLYALAAIGALALEIAAASVIITKMGNGSVRSILTILAFSGALALVAKVLENIKWDKFRKASLEAAASLGLMMTAMAAVTFAAGRGSLRGLLTMLASVLVLKAVVQAIEDLQTSGALKTIIDNIKDVAVGVGAGALALVGAITVTTLAIGKAVMTFGQALAGIGIGVAGFGAAIYLVVLALEKLNDVTSKMTTKTLITATVWITGIMGLLVLMTRAFAYTENIKPLKFITALAGIMGAMWMMVLMTDILGGMKPEELEKGGIAVGGFIALLTLLVAAMGQLKDVKAGAVIGLMAGITMILAELFIISAFANWDAISKAMGAIIGVMGLLVSVAWSMSMIKGVKMGPLVTMMLGLVALTGIMAMAMNVLQDANIENIIAVGASIGLGISVMILAFAKAAKIAKSSIKTLDALTKAMIAITGAVSAMALGMYILKDSSLESIIASGATLAVGVSLMFLAFAGAAKFASGKTKEIEALTSAVGAISVMMLMFAGAVNIISTIEDSWIPALAVAGGISAIILALGGAAAIAKNAAASLGALTSVFLTLSLAMLAFSALLVVTDSVKTESLIWASAIVGGLLVIVTGLGALVGFLPPIQAGLLALDGVFLSLSGLLTTVAVVAVAFGVTANLLALSVGVFAGCLTLLTPAANGFCEMLRSNLDVLNISVLTSIGTGLSSLAFGLGAVALVGVGFAFSGAAIAIVLLALTGVMKLASIVMDDFADSLAYFNNTIAESKSVSFGQLAAIAGGIALVSLASLLAYAATPAILGLAGALYTLDVVSSKFTVLNFLRGKKTGENYAAGLIEGVDEGQKAAMMSGAQIGLTLMDGTMTALDEHSPSVEAEDMGINFGRGLVNGVDRTKGIVYNAGLQQGNSLLSGLSDSINKGSDKLIDLVGGKDSRLGGIISDGTDWIQDKIKGVDEYISNFDASSILNLDEFKDKLTGGFFGGDAEGGYEKVIEEVKNSLGFDGGIAGNLQNVDTAGKGATASTRKFTDTLRSSIKVFEKFNAGAKVTADTLKKNLSSNYNGLKNYLNDLKKLMSRGISKELFKELADLGPSGANTVKAFVRMSNDELEAYDKKYLKTIKMTTNGAAKLVEDYLDDNKKVQKAATDTAKKAAEETADVFESTREEYEEYAASLTSSVDILTPFKLSDDAYAAYKADLKWATTAITEFTKSEDDSRITAQKLIKNLKSQTNMIKNLSKGYSLLAYYQVDSDYIQQMQQKSQEEQLRMMMAILDDPTAIQELNDAYEEFTVAGMTIDNQILTKYLAGQWEEIPKDILKALNKNKDQTIADIHDYFNDLAKEFEESNLKASLEELQTQMIDSISLFNTFQKVDLGTTTLGTLTNNAEKQIKAMETAQELFNLSIAKGLDQKLANKIYDEAGDTAKQIAAFIDVINSINQNGVEEANKKFNDLYKSTANESVKTFNRIRKNNEKMADDIVDNYLAREDEILAGTEQFVNKFVPFQVAADTSIRRLAADLVDRTPIENFQAAANIATESFQKLGVTMIWTDDRFADYKKALLECSEDSELLAEKTSEYIGKVLAETHDKIKSSIQSSMDIFSKFGQKATLSAEQQLENMRGTVKGYQNWQKNLDNIADKIGNSELGLKFYQALVDKGIGGYDIVNAIANMTGPQLQEAIALFGQSLQMPDEIADGIMANYATLGDNIADGLLDGIRANAGEIKDQAEKMSTAFLGELRSEHGFDTNSPSKKTKEIGTWVGQGLANGIKGQTSNVTKVAKSLADNVKTSITNVLTKSAFKTVGSNICAGINSGISAGRSGVINTAVSMAVAAYNAAKSALQINSPSKKFEFLGSGIVEGFVKGVDENESMAAKSAKGMANNTIDTVGSAIKRMNEIIMYGVDRNPVITPSFDLTNVRRGASAIAGMFNDTKLNVDATAESFKNNQNGSGTNMTFVQNNYSPKALSRSEIYRQTNNQFAALKGVIA